MSGSNVSVSWQAWLFASISVWKDVDVLSRVQFCVDSFVSMIYCKSWPYFILWRNLSYIINYDQYFFLIIYFYLLFFKILIYYIENTDLIYKFFQIYKELMHCKIDGVTTSSQPAASKTKYSGLTFPTFRRKKTINEHRNFILCFASNIFIRFESSFFKDYLSVGLYHRNMVCSKLRSFWCYCRCCFWCMSRFTNIFFCSRKARS